MPNDKRWWEDLTERLEGDPEYLAEKIAADLALRVEGRLEERDMSRKDLADRLKVSKAYVSQVLNGHTNMTLLSLCKLAHALDLQIRIEMAPRDVPAAVDSMHAAFGHWIAQTIDAAGAAFSSTLLERNRMIHSDLSTPDVAGISLIGQGVAGMFLSGGVGVKAQVSAAESSLNPTSPCLGGVA